MKMKIRNVTDAVPLCGIRATKNTVPQGKPEKGCNKKPLR